MIFSYIEFLEINKYYNWKNAITSIYRSFNLKGKVYFILGLSAFMRTLVRK